jgi:hypothetical protein
MSKENLEETEIVKMTDSFMASMERDDLGLWAISGSVRWRRKQWNNEAIKLMTIEIVRRLLQRGLQAWDYAKTGFHIWPKHQTDAVIARIDREWEVAKDKARLFDPTCWFCQPGEDSKVAE